MINGKAPEQGNRLYDLQRGAYGKVTRVERDGSFTLEFPGNGTMRYSADGHFGGRRRVYWADPVIVEPMHSATAWALFVKTTNSLADLISGVTPEDTDDEVDK